MKLLTVFLFLLLSTVFTGCNDNMQSLFTISVEKNGVELKKFSGRLKAISKESKGLIIDTFVDERSGEVLFEEFSGMNSYKNFGEYAVTYKDDSISYLVCLESVKGTGPDDRQVYHLHFNLDIPCTNPYAATQKIIQKELLRRIFGTKGQGQRDAINTKKRNSLKESEESETRQSKSESVAI